MFEKFVDIQIENGAVDSDDKELVIYGLKEGLLLIANIATTVVIGVIMNMWLQAVIFLLIYSPLRMFAGGSHSKTQLRCYLSSIVIVLLVLISINHLPKNDILITCAIITSGIIIFLLSPVEDSNKPLDELEVKTYRKRARIILIIEILICFVFLILDMKTIAMSIAVSIFTLAIILLIGLYKNKRCEIIENP